MFDFKSSYGIFENLSKTNYNLKIERLLDYAKANEDLANIKYGNNEKLCQAHQVLYSEHSVDKKRLKFIKHMIDTKFSDVYESVTIFKSRDLMNDDRGSINITCLCSSLKEPNKIIWKHPSSTRRKSRLA